MPEITILPKELKNKIAAGEVVERPASVLKELVENSIDAGSTRIEVEVKKGGRALIRVTDDGAGMDTQDALLSIERHATSKLITEDDLFNLHTLGFRGEALPSIASVSRMSIRAATRDAAEGISIELDGGEITEKKASPANQGTSVEVKDLFFNTPARRKFLKRDATELMHIVEMLTMLALSHPETGFTLTSDGTTSMDLPPASGLTERLTQVYGTEFVEELIKVEATGGQYALEAYVSEPGHMRERRTHQHLFINGRPIRDPSLAHAVYGGYEGIAPRDRHPVFFVFLTLPPSEVDFNVHPAKREVRLSEKDSAYRFLRHSVAEAVRGPRIEQALEAMEEGAGGPTTGPTHDTGEGQVSDAAAHIEYKSADGSSAFSVSEALPMEYRTGLRPLYLGESFLAYTDGGGLVVLDHHAAHERVLYEKLLGGLPSESHMLLFPRQVRLSHKEYMTVLEHKDMLMEFGIEVDDFGQDTVVVRSLPPELEEADLRGILSEAAVALREGEKPGQSLGQRVAASIACHNSVRGSRILTPEELAALLASLEEAEDPEHCPHGRPTRLFYTIKDLRKAFKRS